MTRNLALVMVVLLSGVGCKPAAAPTIRVDPVALKQAREKAAREEAEQAAAEAKARAVARRAPSEAEQLRVLVAERKETCEVAGRYRVYENPTFVEAARARFRDKNPQQVKRSLALIPAAARGDLADLRRLLARGADPNIDLTVDFTLSPLAWAARCDHVEAVELLVRAGARVNKPLGWGWGRASYSNSSALIWASRAGADRAVERLLRLGARPMREIVHSDEGAAPGETPAEVAPSEAIRRRLAK